VDLDGFVSWLRRRNRTRSIPQYSRIVRRYLDDPDELEAKMSDRDYSPNYRRHLVACVRAWAQYTGDGDLIVRLSEIRMPAAIPVTPREPLTWDVWWEIQDTIANSDLHDGVRLVCSMISLRGIRCGDALRLRRRELTTALDTGVLAFEGKGERRIEYSAEPLREYLQELTDLHWEGGRRVYQLISPTHDTAARVVRRAFDTIAIKLDMDPADLHAHRFRHTYAHFFLQELVGDPEAVFKLQEQMGWAKLETAASYLRRDRRKELNEVESRMLSDRKRTKGV
jgi:integrase